jgi:hypothetical protein
MGPMWLLVLNFFFLTFFILTVVHIFRSFWKTRKPYYGMLSVGAIVAGSFYITAVLGLGFELFRVEICTKFIISGYAASTPLYLVILFWRFRVFQEFYPPWLKFLRKVTIVQFFVFSVVINVCSTWPLHLYAFAESLERSHSWIYHYHFIGWGIWTTTLFILDFLISIYSLQFVVHVKRSASSSAQLTGKQRKYFRICVTALVFMLFTDLLNFFQTFRLIAIFRHPLRDEMNMLTTSFILHLVIAIWFMHGVGIFMVSKSTNVSSVAGPLKKDNHPSASDTVGNNNALNGAGNPRISDNPKIHANPQNEV